MLANEDQIDENLCISDKDLEDSIEDRIQKFSKNDIKNGERQSVLR